MTDFEKLMNSPSVLDDLRVRGALSREDVDARENESIEDILDDYDQLDLWRGNLAHEYLQAEVNPALYAGLDEERADVNERAVEILDRLVTAVRHVWNGPVRVVRPSETRRLEDLVQEATEKIDLDDTENHEAHALWAALDEALALLGRDDLR